MMMIDRYLQEDLLYIADSRLLKHRFDHSSVLVTGATGLVGSQIVKALLIMNQCYDAGIRVFAMIRDKEKAKEIYQDIPDDGLCFVEADLTSPIVLSEHVDYIIHTASPTASRYFVNNPVETIQSAFLGTDHILQLARDQKVKGVVYLSSMEAYGITDPELSQIQEQNLGYIDVLNVRSSYSEGKRICECLCASYAKEYQVPVTIARLAQTFGSGITYKENRVFAQFAKSVIEQKDIVLHTRGLSYGNYCYTRDCVIGILLLLLKGERGEAYNVANEETNITIGNMAKMVAEEIAEGKIKVIFDIPQDSQTYGYAPDVKMKLSSEKLRGLGWKPEIGLKEAYLRLIGSLEISREHTQK